MEIDEEGILMRNRNWYIVKVTDGQWLILPRNIEVHPDRKNKLATAEIEERGGKDEVWIYDDDNILTDTMKQTISRSIRASIS